MDEQTKIPNVVVMPEAEQPDIQAEQEEPVQAAEPDSPDTITWTASEFIAHDKSSGWYLMLMLAAAGVSVLVFFITRDIISVVVVAVAAIVLAMYGSHKPRQLEYKINPQGITIGPKNYPFDHYRSFSVIPEGAFSSIVFMPLKRFSPPLSIYYDPDDEQSILDLLNKSLPFEERKRDAVDSLMHKIRF